MAAECSPGRKPQGFCLLEIVSPRRATDDYKLSVARVAGSPIFLAYDPRAYARGYIMPPASQARWASCFQPDICRQDAGDPSIQLSRL